MVDMKVSEVHVVHLLVSDSQREQLVAPALLAEKIERWRMTLVLAGASIDQNRVARCAHHEGLIGDDDHSERRVEHLRFHRGQMVLEDGLIIGGEEVLRPPPWALAFDHRIDGDVADPKLLHSCFLSLFPGKCGGERNGRLGAVQAAGGRWSLREQACCSSLARVTIRLAK